MENSVSRWGGGVHYIFGNYKRKNIVENRDINKTVLEKRERA